MANEPQRLRPLIKKAQPTSAPGARVSVTTKGTVIEPVAKTDGTQNQASARRMTYWG